VSIVKAGAKIAGHDAGPVRPPLVDLTADECARLATLMQALGPQ
jgi:5-dehydro-4-deoxyglucarate dehydratase